MGHMVVVKGAAAIGCDLKIRQQSFSAWSEDKKYEAWYYV